MKVEFEITEAQMDAVKRVQELPNFRGKTTNEAVRLLFLASLIETSKQLVQLELSKE